jgi:phosphocarrier protein HPr
MQVGNTSTSRAGCLRESKPENGSLDAPCPPASVPDGAFVRDLPIVNKKGLHARATAKFVQTAEGFDADITVTRCGETVGGTSIMGILTLGAGIGTTITVTARGPEARQALEAITALVADRFGEEE